jgi:hypothetical protein
MIGEGWKRLAEELADELAALTPPGELLQARLNQHGLLAFSVRLPPESRAAGRKLVRDYEARAAVTCERCGDAGTVRGGVIVRILCDACFD